MTCLRCDYTVQHEDQVQKTDNGKQWVCPNCNLKNWATQTETHKKHPLINSDSPHYKMVGGVEAVEYLEVMFTIEELQIWSKITAMKYRLRIGKKDDATKELQKIKTFEEYFEYLESKNDR